MRENVLRLDQYTEAMMEGNMAYGAPSRVALWIFDVCWTELGMASAQRLEELAGKCDICHFCCILSRSRLNHLLYSCLEVMVLVVESPTDVVL